MKTNFLPFAAFFIFLGLHGFSFASEPLPQEKVQTAINEALLQNPDFLALSKGKKTVATITNMKRNIFIPEGELSVDVVLPETKRFLGHQTVSVKLFVDKKFIRKDWISLNIDTFDTIVLAKKNLKHNTVITQDDVYEEVRNISKLPTGAITEASEIIGKQLVKGIPADTCFVADYLKDPPVAKKGDIISLAIKNSFILVTTKGILLEDGFKGKLVRVKNIDSNKVVIGRFSDNDEVLIE